MLKIVLLFLLAAGTASAPASIEDLAWLRGCWSNDHGEEGSGEQWSKPAGGSMLGISRFVSNGETVAYEFLRISETDDGSLSYFAAPSGQVSSNFALASIATNTVTFEDPQHDFPQRISYTLIAPDRLLGRIEGQSKGKLRGVDFPMTRVDCDD